jgi:hypothetical protein
MAEVFERLFKILLVLLFGIIFIPAFLIVNFGADFWKKLLSDVGL